MKNKQVKQLKATAKNYPNVEEFYVSSDGFIFINENDAVAHQGTVAESEAFPKSYDRAAIKALKEDPSEEKAAKEAEEKAAKEAEEKAAKEAEEKAAKEAEEKAAKEAEEKAAKEAAKDGNKKSNSTGK